MFDCSFKPAKGTRSISYMGHIKMMGATQPFLSGAISKTVNLPQDCSVDDIAEAYMESWRQGLKAVAIYRDNSKGTQPLNVTAQTDADKKGTRGTNAVAPAAAGSIEIEEAVVAAKAAAAAAVHRAGRGDRLRRRRRPRRRPRRPVARPDRLGSPTSLSSARDGSRQYSPRMSK